MLTLPDQTTIRMTRSVAPKDPVEFWKVDVDNKGDARNWELGSFVDWAMGGGGPAFKADTKVELDKQTGAIFARNPNTISPESVAFHVAVGGDTAPALDDVYGAPDDHSEGLKTGFRIGKGEKKSMVFMLGQADNEAQARQIIAKYNTVKAVTSEQATETDAIDHTINAVQIDKTNNPKQESLGKISDILKWLTYQAKYAHTAGRTGWNQSGGAWGGRDQIQTFTNLLSTGTAEAKEDARKHLLWSARHQFEMGKVAHWAHDMPDGKDLAQLSTVSDTHLWLPWSLSQYLSSTDDWGLLKEQEPWLVNSRPLNPGEPDLVERMPVSDKTASIYEHAKKAIEWTLTNGMSPRGLPLIAKGDWNDALDDVGRKGTGERVWLGFFMYDTLNKFIDIARHQGDAPTVERYTLEAVKLKKNLNDLAWNGEGFYRAFDDNLQPIPITDALGSWAVLSKATTRERALKTMATLVRELYDPKNKMILLMKGDTDALGGGAAAYPPGVRESGQYTHGVSWMIRALYELGEGDLATELLTAMLPNVHADDPRYKAEPFSLVADILAGEHVGEAGWTWYSGSAGWMTRIIIEDLLGLKISHGNQLVVDPSLPKAWPGLSYSQKFGSATYRVTIENPHGVNRGVEKMTVGGDEVKDPSKGIEMVDDGKVHEIKVVLGGKKDAGDLRLADVAPDLAKRFPSIAR